MQLTVYYICVHRSSPSCIFPTWPLSPFTKENEIYLLQPLILKNCYSAMVVEKFGLIHGKAATTLVTWTGL